MGEHSLIGKRVSAAEVTGTLSLVSLNELAQTMSPDSWRMLSDEAQTVAHYLMRHPRVSEVRYPGLKADPLYAQASCTLQRGFGPYVAIRLFNETSWILWKAEKGNAIEDCLCFEKELSDL